ncbi:XRE family transcriptional regulator [Spiroplasma corruscae]|uniref:XRE family transcriptional regulator n=1 Tax=Spiroplasma corruscae TaxID=216934 RepID=A0A222EMV3_9MOLU|nr:helix-turn-helix transcriptional regulator [Spiroplasma corruscae]ASP27840.1 XRE family transcriptional regulator [Spiroplasma corruscae]
MEKNTILEIFSQNMKRLRQNARITQEELSFRSGLHKNYISDAERGKRNISLKAIEKLARGLDIDLTEFFLQSN